MTEHELFVAAREKSDPDERTAFLDEACAGDSALRQRVESLLTEQISCGSDAEIRDFPTRLPEQHAHRDDTKTAAGTTGSGATAPGPTDRIGPYKLLGQLGEGGMGVVYLAEQERPVRRRVAVKVVRSGHATSSLIARFQAELQALALMDHPNIAKVLDAGSTDTGWPYFVMELVEGVPIGRYCESCRLSLRERVSLFIPVCKAIQHAHQKGIIHRDIKPSNVLVAVKEGLAVPKVIDFGVAKAIDQKLTDETLRTHFGAIIGTLEYMSPEQAESSPAGIDTRSDVYSLGVLLYELLAGSTPLGKLLLRQPRYVEMLRIIQEEEPQPPSVRVATADDRKRLADQRQTDDVRLPRYLRGELDWIVMKALEKDRTRRYETAEALARDVERYLRDEPVEASPPSTAYRVRKFVRKHRAWLTAGAAFALLLVAAAAVSTVLAVRATRLAQQATEAESRTRDEMRRADEQAATALAISDFLRNDLLAQASAEGQARPGVRPDQNVTVRTLLDRASERVAGKFADKPLVEAAVRQTIGNTYSRLGLYPQAEKQLQLARDINIRVLGDDHPDTLASLNNLAVLYEAEGNYDKAEPIFARVLDIKSRILGEENPETLTAMNNLGLLYHARGRFKEAEPLLWRAYQLRRRQFGEENADTLASMNNLALLYEAQGRYSAAEPLLAATLELRQRLLGDDHPNTLTSTSNLGNLYRTIGRLDLAEKLISTAFEHRRRVLGESHPDTLASMGSLALLYSARHQFEKAEPLFKQLLDDRSRELGDSHPQTLATMTNLGLVYESLGEFAKAEPLLSQAADGRAKALGPEHPDSLMALNNLGVLYLTMRQQDKAEPLFTRALEAQRRTLGPDHPATRQTEGNLVRAYEARGEFSKAEELLTKSLSDRQRKGEESAEAASTAISLGHIRLHQGKYAEAEQPLRDGLRAFEKHAPKSWQRESAQALLGASLAGQKKYAEAEPLLLGGFTGLKAKQFDLPAEIGAILPETADNLVRLYEALGQPEKAAHWRQERDALKQANGAR
jgi:non-specific serine/threonine protein kinase/serine/threonine-protein kinase